MVKFGINGTYTSNGGDRRICVGGANLSDTLHGNPGS